MDGPAGTDGHGATRAQEDGPCPRVQAWLGHPPARADGSPASHDDRYGDTEGGWCMYCKGKDHDVLDCLKLEDDKVARNARRAAATKAASPRNGEQAVSPAPGQALAPSMRPRKPLAEGIDDSFADVQGHNSPEDSCLLTVVVNKSGYERRRAVQRDMLFNNGAGLAKDAHSLVRMKILRSLLDCVICITQEAELQNTDVKDQTVPPVLFTHVSEAIGLIAPDLHKVALSDVGVAKLLSDGTQEVHGSTLGKVFRSLSVEKLGESNNVIENVKRSIEGGDPKKMFSALTGVRALQPGCSSDDATAVRLALAHPFVRWVSGSLSEDQQVDMLQGIASQAPRMMLSGQRTSEATKRPLAEVMAIEKLSDPSKVTRLGDNEASVVNHALAPPDVG